MWMHTMCVCVYDPMICSIAFQRCMRIGIGYLQMQYMYVVYSRHFVHLKIVWRLEHCSMNLYWKWELSFPLYLEKGPSGILEVLRMLATCRLTQSLNSTRSITHFKYNWCILVFFHSIKFIHPIRLSFVKPMSI